MSRRSSPAVNLTCAILCSTASLALLATRADAHIRMDMPPARNTQDGYKPTRTPGFVLPCGIARSAAQPVTTLAAGSTIGMKFTETISHPGCFIVDFAKTDTGPKTMFTRLQVEPHGPGADENKVYQLAVKLPAEPCTNCILRLRQYMQAATPCPPVNLVDTNADLYYSCANVVLTADGTGTDAGAVDGPAAVDVAGDAPLAGGSGGASGTGGAASGGAPGTNGAGGSGGAGSGGASGSGGGSGRAGTIVDTGSAGCALGGRDPGAVTLPFGVALVVLVLTRRRRAAAQRRG